MMTSDAVIMTYDDIIARHHDDQAPYFNQFSAHNPWAQFVLSMMWIIIFQDIWHPILIAW